jgi:TRAP-type mannitol/chloroaromatic compound transport system permease small subunit
MPRALLELKPSAERGFLLRLADRVAGFGLWFSGGLILLAAFLVSYDVLARKLFNLSLGGADELSGYALAIGCAWAFSFALLQRVNVRIDALYQCMPQSIARALDIVALLVLGWFVVLLCFYGFSLAFGSYERGAMSNSQLKVPLWIPQGLWFLGLAAFAFTWFALALRTLQALLARDMIWVKTNLGARSIQDDAADELEYSKSL